MFSQFDHSKISFANCCPNIVGSNFSCSFVRIFTAIVRHLICGSKKSSVYFKHSLVDVFLPWSWSYIVIIRKSTNFFCENRVFIILERESTLYFKFYILRSYRRNVFLEFSQSCWASVMVLSRSRRHSINSDDTKQLTLYTKQGIVVHNTDFLNQTE